MRRVLFALALSFGFCADSAFSADVPYVPPAPLKVLKKTKVASQKPARLIRVAVLPKGVFTTLHSNRRGENEKKGGLQNADDYKQYSK